MSGPLLRYHLGWHNTGMLQRKVNRQAGCNARQMYANDSTVTSALRAAYGLDIELYAHARKLFCKALSSLLAGGAGSSSPHPAANQNTPRRSPRFPE